MMEKPCLCEKVVELLNHCETGTITTTPIPIPIPSGGCWKEPFPLLEKQHIIKVVTIPPLNRDGTQYKLKTDWNDCVTYDECPTVPQVSE